MKKNNCLEGIRLIACVSIFLCHFRGAFLPDWSYWGDGTPLRILTADNTVVRLLFTLSGFVISYNYLINGNDRKGVPADIIKRYFRLAPPIIFSNVIVYFLMKAGLMYNISAGILSGSDTFLASFNNFTPSIQGCLKEALYSCYFYGANDYIGPLWIIQYEFLGSILVLGAICVCGDGKLRSLFYLIFMLFYGTSYYSYFVLGMIVCDLYRDKNVSTTLQEHRGLNNICFFIGLWLVTMVDITDAFSCYFWGFGTVIFLTTLINSSWGERALGGRILRKGGDLSYCFYIVHWPVIECFSSAYYIWAVGKGIDPRISILTNLVGTMVIIFLAAYFLNIYIEKIGKEITKYITNYFTLKA